MLVCACVMTSVVGCPSRGPPTPGRGVVRVDGGRRCALDTWQQWLFTTNPATARIQQGMQPRCGADPGHLCFQCGCTPCFLQAALTSNKVVMASSPGHSRALLVNSTSLNALCAASLAACTSLAQLRSSSACILLMRSTAILNVMLHWVVCSNRVVSMAAGSANLMVPLKHASLESRAACR